MRLRESEAPVVCLDLLCVCLLCFLLVLFCSLMDNSLPRVSATMRIPSLYVIPKTEDVVTTGLVVSLGGEGRRPVMEQSRAV